MAYKSKYTGKQVDDLLTRIEEGDLDITIDTDLSPESTNAIANSAVTNALNNKVDKVEGKGLSTNDFTDEYKRKVEEFSGGGSDFDTNGYYPSMTVGKADNLVGLGKTTDVEFEFQPSAGTLSIEDGTARVVSIRGNSVVWNQTGGSFTALKGHKYRVFFNGQESLVQYNQDTYIEADLATDLSLMLGADASLQNFHLRTPMNINEYAHDEGTIVNMRVNAIKSVGENAYDSSVGYAKVVGGKNYNLEGTYTELYYISTDGARADIELDATTFYAYTDGYIYAQGKDICINISHSYYKDISHAYEENTLRLPIFENILHNGVQLFPDGLCSAGTTYDEIRYNRTTKKWEAVTRIGEVDLGSFTWRTGSTSNVDKGVKRIDSEEHIANMARPQNSDSVANILCERYVADSANSVYLNKPNTICVLTNGSINIYDENYNANDGSDLASFKQAMQGVMLYYELEKPIIEEIEGSENWNLDYSVWDFGSEEAIATEASTPFRGGTIYQFNAIDRIDDNTRFIGELREEVDDRFEEVANEAKSIIVDYTQFNDWRMSDIEQEVDGIYVEHPEVRELAQKILNNPTMPILIRVGYVEQDELPYYYVANTQILLGAEGQQVIALNGATAEKDISGKTRLTFNKVEFDENGIISVVEHKQENLINEDSVINNLTSYGAKKPLSANQGRVLKQELDKKPNSDGYYSDMSVGMSDNLVGRGDVQDAQINFRPSAGADNITDGAARIERIKGNSVVWNNFGEIASFVTTNMGRLHEGAHIVQGHKYLFYRTNTSGSLFLVQNVDGTEKYDCKITEGNNYVFYTALYSLSYPNISLYNQSGLGDKIILADLTQMFGAGNEPTTYEAYLLRKPKNIEDEFAYNAGTLVDMKVDSLISTSDNAYDYVEGYARVMGGHTYDCSYGTAFVEKVYFSTNKDNIVAEENAMISENGKYTFPSDGYAVPYTDDGDVREYCVCLQHTYTKPHPPYQQEVKDLSWIGEIKDSDGNLIFPDGLRQTPLAVNDNLVAIADTDAFDEVRYNRTTRKWEAVKRIGKVSGVTFQSTSAENVFIGIIPDLRMAAVGVYHECRNGLLTAKYGITLGVGYSTMSDKAFLRAQKGQSVDGAFFIKDTAYSTVADFNEANKDLVIYYELAKPIVTEIDGSENWNLDYIAWDFGTEEALASVPSAPFRADINYEPNAVDDLRWAVDEIRKLKTQLAEVQASVTNLTE